MHEAPDDTPCCVSCKSRMWDTELAAGRWACYRCEDKAATRLKAMPGMFATLSTVAALIKGTSRGGGQRVKQLVPPVPLRIPVLSITAEGGAVTVLQDIEDSWRKTLGWTVGAKHRYDDIHGATSFVLNNLPWACGNYEEIAYDLQQIHNVHSDMDNLIKQEPPVKKLTVYCGQDGCTGQMKIRHDTKNARCPDCRYPYAMGELRNLDTEYGPNPRSETAVA